MTNIAHAHTNERSFVWSMDFAYEDVSEILTAIDAITASDIQNCGIRSHGEENNQNPELDAKAAEKSAGEIISAATATAGEQYTINTNSGLYGGNNSTADTLRNTTALETVRPKLYTHQLGVPRACADTTMNGDWLEKNNGDCLSPSSDGALRWEAVPSAMYLVLLPEVKQGPCVCQHCQNCHNASFKAPPADLGSSKRVNNENLLRMVNNSQRRPGFAPEACAVPELLYEKEQVERELLAVVPEEPATSDESFDPYQPYAVTIASSSDPMLAEEQGYIDAIQEECNNSDKDIDLPNDVADLLAKEVEAIDVHDSSCRVVNRGAW
jgi:hypothetical protein